MRFGSREIEHGPTRSGSYPISHGDIDDLKGAYLNLNIGIDPGVAP
jgi:hypothetical protein